MKRSLLPLIKVLAIIFVPGVLTFYVATLFAKKGNLKKIKNVSLTPRKLENYHG